MPSKEKVLLVVVLAAVAGVAAMDRRYEPVKVPATRPPADVPPVPVASDPSPRSPKPSGRSMLEPYSDLLPPPVTELPDLPVPAMPTAVPPVVPWPLMNAAGAVPRHFLFDPAEKPSEAEPASTGGEPPVEETAPIAGTPKADDAPPPPDLALFDWVLPLNALGANKLYGHVEIAAEDARKGRDRYDLLVDPAMEFSFNQIDIKTGKPFGAAPNFRARTAELGFADTIENNYLSKRRRLEFSLGAKNLDISRLRDLVKWSLEQSSLPKYPRRAAWDYAAKDLREILRRSPDDKETLKELGRVLRLLQDLESEVRLYDWWLDAQKISKDPEVLALSGEAVEMLGLRERARERYEQALATNPDPRVRLRLAEILVSTGSLEDAERAVREFQRAAQDGERFAGTVGEARARLARGELDAAEQALGKVGSPDREGTWYAAMGAVHYARGKLDEARAHFQAGMEKARSGDEAFAAARTDLAVAKARIAAALPDTTEEEVALRNRGLEEARKTAEDALRDDPLNYYWPQVAKAYALRAAGERDKAVEVLQEAVAALPQEAYGRYLLGDFLLRDGRNAESRTQFLEASRLAPRFPDGLGGVGRAGGGAPGEAKEYLRRAAELDPRNGLWPLLSARMAILDEGLPEAQRLEEARKDLTALLDHVDRNSIHGQIYLGWVRYYQGDAEDSLACWNKAQRLVRATKAGSAREQELLDRLDDWLKISIQKVAKWMATRIWPDEFDRPDGPSVGNGWVEEEKNVKWAIKDKGAVLGPGRLGDKETPTLYYDWDQAKLLKGRITVQVDPSEPSQVDVRFWVASGKQEGTVLGIQKTEAGDLRLLLKKDQRDKQTQSIELPGVKWPEDGKVTFGWVKKDEEKGRVTLLLNDEVIKGYEDLELQTFVKSRGGKVRGEVKCTAGPGTQVSVRVERAEVWRDVQP